MSEKERRERERGDFVPHQHIRLDESFVTHTPVSVDSLNRIRPSQPRRMREKEFSERGEREREREKEEKGLEKFGEECRD
jgi:hypothetical protein